MSREQPNLDRFLDAQAGLHGPTYEDAIEEMRQGSKQSHWMWFVAPQIRGLGQSSMAMEYGLDVSEVEAYLEHEVLGARLLEFSRAVLDTLELGISLQDLFGFPDDLKMVSSLTLFSEVAVAGNTSPEFRQVAERILEVADAQGIPRCAQTLDGLSGRW